MISNEERNELYQLMTTLEVDTNDIDVVLLGDGSGMVLEKPCGWSVRAIWLSANDGSDFRCFGGTNSGTNNYAELMPYIHTLWKIYAARPTEKWRVLIVSDSELTVNCGSGRYARKANLPLWASIDWFSNNGWKLTWKHVRRNSNSFMLDADVRSRSMRNLIEANQ